MSLGHCHSLGEVYFAPELARHHPYEGRENLLSSTNSFLSCVICAWKHIFIGFNKGGTQERPSSCFISYVAFNPSFSLFYPGYNGSVLKPSCKSFPLMHIIS